MHHAITGFPVVNDPLYNHKVFGPEKGKGGNIGKTDEQLIQDLIAIHNAENWLGMDENGGSGPGDGGLGPVGGLPVSTMRSTAEIKENKIPAGSSEPTPEKSTPSNESSPSTKPRAETPDSAVDVRSMSTMADSPSSTASGNDFKEHKNNVGTEVKQASACANELDDSEKVTTATQTGIEEADQRFDQAKLSIDPHCYECKVKYRDPRPKDLVMFLHAYTYSVSRFESD